MKTAGYLTFAAQTIDIYGTLISKDKKLRTQRVCVANASKKHLRNYVLHNNIQLAQAISEDQIQGNH